MEDLEFAREEGSFPFSFLQLPFLLFLSLLSSSSPSFLFLSMKFLGRGLELPACPHIGSGPVTGPEKIRELSHLSSIMKNS